MRVKLQLVIIVSILLFVGIGSLVYKHFVLGFPFLPAEKITTWTVDATVSFTADGGPLEISLNLPDASDTLRVLDVINTGGAYSFNTEDRRALWRGEAEPGEDQITLRSKVALYPADEPLVAPEYPQLDGELSPAALKSADKLIQQAVSEGKDDQTKVAVNLLADLNSAANQDAKILHEEADDFGGKVQMACALLQKAGIAARPVKGLQLEEKKNVRQLQTYIEIRAGEEIVLLNPRTAAKEKRESFLLWQKNQESLLELTGASKGKITLSVLSGKMAAERSAVMHGKYKRNLFVDFSIYSLPVKDQNTFKLLLLIPIGALVVVILRNLVGIPTSGTFMPILIALVFLQTHLISGLVLFLIVVSVGLILRSYLSHLNLLLVPRISAVLVFVIVIYVAISVTSYKLGIESGMQVTFFPMIIISWTIERMSVLWEEEGPKDVLKQGGGSLFAASLIYFAMSNPYIGHLTYSFPEILLVVLAVIIMIGSYSGYRLTELRRFEPLAGRD